MSSRRPAALSRRTALGWAGGAVGAALLSSCDLGDGPDGQADVPGPGGSDADPDRELVDRVVGDVTARLAAVAAARQAFPALVDPLSALEDMHRAHLAALASDPATPSVPAAPGPRPRGARATRRKDARLRADETVHQQSLVTAALTARSGALARLLASMAASVGQHLAVPPPPPAAAPVAAPPDQDTVLAWQTTLAGEHAAVYVWAVLGARTSASASAALFDAVSAAYVEHRERRDVLVGLLAGAGATPTPAAPAYVLPGGLDDPTGVSAAAVGLEEGSATTYAALVAATSTASREQAIGWLEISAIRVLAFRGTPEMFPGAGEYADR